MTITVEATYENGLLKPVEPLPLREHERVEITFRTRPSAEEALKAVARTYGMIGWTGDAETVERVALDPEFGIQESP